MVSWPHRRATPVPGLRPHEPSLPVGWPLGCSETSSTVLGKNASQRVQESNGVELLLLIFHVYNVYNVYNVYSFYSFYFCCMFPTFPH